MIKNVFGTTLLQLILKLFKFHFNPAPFPSPADEIPSVHKPKERLQRSLIHNPLGSNGVTRWRVRVRYINLTMYTIPQRLTVAGEAIARLSTSNRIRIP